jgi:hypothetical protein
LDSVYGGKRHKENTVIENLRYMIFLCNSDIQKVGKRKGGKRGRESSVIEIFLCKSDIQKVRNRDGGKQKKG